MNHCFVIVERARLAEFSLIRQTDPCGLAPKVQVA
jgi:hypothetical protein